MFQGTTIEELFEIVARAEEHARTASTALATMADSSVPFWMERDYSSRLFEVA